VSALAGLAGRDGRDGELVVAVIEVDIERREMPRALMPRYHGSTSTRKARRKTSSSLEILEKVISSM